MVHHGRFSRERWRERWADQAWGEQRWNDPWVEHAVMRQQARQQDGRRARLWMPVLVSFVVQVPTVFFSWHPGSAPTAARVTPMLLLTLAIALVGPVALVFARRFPGPVVAITAAAASADLLLATEGNRPPYVALAFAVVSAIVRRARPWAWISIAAAWVLTLTIAIVLGLDLQPGRVAAITLGILIVLGVGEGIRTRRDNYNEFARRFAERKQSEVQAERVRIARELHDVLAHSLSSINVQAGVGLHLMDSHPEKAAEALAAIKETSKTALDEVRSVLGVLRAEGGADPSAPLVPEPDLSRLAGLAASIEAQGISVHVDNRIDAPPPAAVQLALYRIAQESLTNVLRHSKAGRVTVRAVHDGDEYELTVTDDGTGSPRSEGGRGLLGMRERAELLGGTLEAGPAAGGGFRVVARIPSHTAETDR